MTGRWWWGWWWVLGVVALVTGVLCGEDDDTRDACARWPEQVTVLIHSCDRYAHYWDGMLNCWRAHTRHLTPPPRVLLATERQLPAPSDREGVSVVQTGPGTWARRLRQSLSSVDTEYVLYVQEDAWLTAPLRASYLATGVHLMTRHRLNVLKLYRGCEHDLYHASPDVHNARWYVVAHQPSLWRTTFLRDTLYDEQEAMAHELETNQMLHQHPQLANTCRCFSDWTSRQFPYEEVSRQGHLLPVGLKLWDTTRKKSVE